MEIRKKTHYIYANPVCRGLVDFPGETGLGVVITHGERVLMFLLEKNQ